MKKVKLLSLLLFCIHSITSFGIVINLKGTTKNFQKPPETYEARVMADTREFSMNNNSSNESPFTNLYDKISEFRSGYAVVEKDGKRGLINKSGEVIIPLQYESISDAAYCGFFVLSDKKMGLVDRSGKLKIPSLYDELEFIYTSDYMIVTSEGRKGVISCNTGKIVIPTLYDDIALYYPNFRTKLDNRYGFYVRDEADKEKFHEIVTPKYQSVNTIGSENTPLIMIELNKQFGCINFKGELLIPTAYDEIRTIGDNYLRVRKEGKWGIIDKANNLIIPIKYDGVLDYRFGMAIVMQEGKYGAISTSGKKGVEFIYDELNLADGIIGAAIDGKNGYLNFNGEVVVKIEYDYTSLSDDGFITVKMGDKYGMFNKKGKRILDPVYDKVEGFSNGLAPIQLNGKYGFLNSSGRIAISPQYDNIMQVDFCFFVRKNEKWGIVYAPKGKEIAKTIYDEISLTSDDIFIIEKGGLEGCLDRFGNLLFPVKYAIIGQIDKADTYIAFYPNKHKVFLDLKTKKELQVEKQ